MKRINNYQLFVEKLSSEVYKKASEILKNKGHISRSEKMRDYYQLNDLMKKFSEYSDKPFNLNLPYSNYNEYLNRYNHDVFINSIWIDVDDIYQQVNVLFNINGKDTVSIRVIQQVSGCFDVEKMKNGEHSKTNYYNLLNNMMAWDVNDNYLGIDLFYIEYSIPIEVNIDSEVPFKVVGKVENIVGDPTNYGDHKLKKSILPHKRTDAVRIKNIILDSLDPKKCFIKNDKYKFNVNSIYRTLVDNTHHGEILTTEILELVYESAKSISINDLYRDDSKVFYL